MVACARTFERFDSFDEFRKAPDVRLYPQIFPVVARRRAADRRARRNITPHLGAPPIFARDPIVK